MWLIKITAYPTSFIGIVLALLVGCVEEHNWAVIVGIIVFAAGFSFPLWAHYIV